MDVKSTLCISVVLVALILHTGAAQSSTDSSSDNSTEPSTNATGSSSVSSSTKPVTTVTTTKVPFKCYDGSCEGEEECTNNTLIDTYKSGLCPSGVCQTEKTVINGTTTYTFTCQTNTCTGTESVKCCKESNCNTYKNFKDENSSASRLFNTLTSIMISILLITLI